MSPARHYDLVEAIRRRDKQAVRQCLLINGNPTFLYPRVWPHHYAEASYDLTLLRLLNQLGGNINIRSLDSQRVTALQMVEQRYGRMRSMAVRRANLLAAGAAQ